MGFNIELKRKEETKMKGIEFIEYCRLFEQFGKIKDIDFDTELFNFQFSDQMYIRFIDFEYGFVTIGELIQFGCECCGDYFDDRNSSDNRFLQ